MRALGLLGALMLSVTGGPHGAPPQGSAPSMTTEEARADVARFRSEVMARDRSYSASARAEAEARLARLDAAAPGMSQAYLELELARIVGLADNGHTASFAGPRSRRYNRVAIRLVPFAEDFYVLRAKERNGDLLGGRLVAIDDQPIAKLREVARALMGGLPAWRDRTAPYLLESPEQLHALGVLAERDAATYRFEGVNEAIIARRLVAEPAGGPERAHGSADRWLYPQPMESEAGRWRALIPAEAAPWPFQEPDGAFRWRDAPDLDALVIELRQNVDRGGQSIGAFLGDMRRRIREGHPRHLVLDMRMNGGGDLTRTREFMQDLPGLIPGRIFALTSSWTFSAAISSVGYLEQAAPDRVVIVGEPVGDRLQFWAEGEIVELPHCRAVILYATERHDYLTGCRAFNDCHAHVQLHPIAVSTLAPDIAAPWTIDAYRAGRDPAMEAVAAALRDGR